MNEATEEELEEAKIFGDIKNLVMTCYLYTKLKALPHNPFVKKLGESPEEIELLQVIRDCTERLTPFFFDEEIEQSEIIENKGVIDTE
jgi:hypothetical protein